MIADAWLSLIPALDAECLFFIDDFIFENYTADDRWYGMLDLTAILNHAVKSENIGLRHLASGGTRAGFWHGN